MTQVDKEAATLRPPPPVPSPEQEQLLKRFDQLDANVTLIGLAVQEIGKVVERLELGVKALRQQVEGAAEASASAIDVATEAKAVIRDSIPPERTLRAICENAEEEAAIAMDVATQIAEQFGVRGIVDRVREEHAEPRSERSRASVGPAR